MGRWGPMKKRACQGSSCQRPVDSCLELTPKAASPQVSKSNACTHLEPCAAVCRPQLRPAQQVGHRPLSERLLHKLPLLLQAPLNTSPAPLRRAAAHAAPRALCADGLQVEHLAPAAQAGGGGGGGSSGAWRLERPLAALERPSRGGLPGCCCCCSAACAGCGRCGKLLGGGAGSGGDAGPEGAAGGGGLCAACGGRERRRAG